MKLLLCALLFASLNVHAHDGDDEPRVVIEPESQSTVSSNSTNYRFQLFDTEKSRTVGESDLEISHERYLHFIVYDPALREFQHVHPTYDGQYWNVTLNFPVSGNFWAWAQGKLKASDDFSTSIRLDVQVAEPAWPDPALSDVRSGSDGISQVTIGSSTLYAGQMAMLDLTFSRTDASSPDITHYLGAIAHVAAVPADGDSLIHVHPMDGSSSNEGLLHVTFPAAGYYRLWIEFMDAGVLRRVPLAVQVN